MRSTFMGLETNKRGLYTQQSALYTTGHNIANANTLGYSRQRVNMEATAGHPGVGLNAGTMPGFLGTGVQSGSIQRIRDAFVDQQFRQESNKFGFWESRTKAISQMEDILNEPSHYGLQDSLSKFWQSLEDLASNPENGGARKVVVGNAEAVADSFNYMHTSLTAIQSDLGNEISVSTKSINSILHQISQLNRQIEKVEPNAYLPNDLYDVRDVLLDELAMYLPIETEYVESGGRALAIAEGSVTVSLKLKDGTKIELVKGKDIATLEPNPKELINIAADGTVTNLPVQGLTVWGVGVDSTDPASTSTSIGHDNLIEVGKLKSLMNSYGKDDGAGGATGLYPDMIAELNKLAAAFANEMNKVHREGTDLEGNQGGNFFDAKVLGQDFTAANLVVSAAIKENPSLIAASTSAIDPGNGQEGNGKNAQNLSNVQFAGLGALNGSTVLSYFQGIIGQLGVSGSEAIKNTTNTATLLGAVEHRRASISSVSLDEEMTDMIRFQQAYNASARMITVVDETLDKIINGMGVVGR